jgi:hypothetical protein
MVLLLLHYSDLHPYHEREKGLLPGTIVGHEFTGVVEECGSQVRIQDSPPQVHMSSVCSSRPWTPCTEGQRASQSECILYALSTSVICSVLGQSTANIAVKAVNDVRDSSCCTNRCLPANTLPLPASAPRGAFDGCPRLHTHTACPLSIGT